MATLMLDRAELELRLADGALAVYENGTRAQTIPLRLLDRVVIQGARTRLDSSVLLKLAETGASTLLMSPRTSKQTAIILGPSHNDAAIRLAQANQVTHMAFCDAWAQQLVIAKLRRQHRFLAKAEARRPDIRKPLFDARHGIVVALTKVSASRPSSASLRGLEGSAARAYFGGYTALFAPALNFTGRNRRPPRDPVNACLSLAYTLLHYDAVRAAHVAGLDPLLGFYHRPAFGRESLACDLIEPLRPGVDEWIWHLFNASTLRAEHFGVDKNACLLGKTGRAQFYSQWESYAAKPRRWLRHRCAHLAKQLHATGSTWLEPITDNEEF